MTESFYYLTLDSTVQSLQNIGLFSEEKKITLHFFRVNSQGICCITALENNIY